MPVTINVNPQITPNPISGFRLKSQQTFLDVLRSSAPEISHGFESLLHSSIPSSDLPKIIPAKNGLIHACIEAYNEHHHLQIRPDDVWITIITQFSYYINAHAEQLREFFVPHIGPGAKRQLGILMPGDPVGAAYDGAAVVFANMMEKELQAGQAGWLKEWILPKFSTTTETDNAVEAMLMMCSLKSYFEYVAFVKCGIPSVTLLGTRDDWVALRERINRLLDFGKEHTELYDWHELLCPLFDRFVDSFSYTEGGVDPAKEKNLKEFWNVICKEEFRGSGGTLITGWIFFLCPFDDKGKWMLTPQISPPTPPNTPRLSKAHLQSLDPNSSDETLTREEENALRAICSQWWAYDRQLESFTKYQAFSELVHATEGRLCKWRTEMKSIPAGTAYCDLIIDDNGNRYDAIMVAGIPAYDTSGNNTDTLRPYPAWWVFKVDVEEKKQLDRLYAQGWSSGTGRK